MQYNAQSQAVNVAAYPQLCGSWPCDEWPEDSWWEQYHNFAELCGDVQIEHGRESMKLQRNDGKVEGS